jgi:hypothetical protein
VDHQAQADVLIGQRAIKEESVTATAQAGVVIVAAMFAPALDADKSIKYLSACK